MSTRKRFETSASQPVDKILTTTSLQANGIAIRGIKKKYPFLFSFYSNPILYSELQNYIHTNLLGPTEGENSLNKVKL